MTKIPLNGMSNLHIIVLRFRFPPINLVQEAPNILAYVPLHADSLLLFADVIKNYKNTDWRFDFIKKSYFREFDREYPTSLKYSEKYGVALSSILMPVHRRSNNTLELYLPAHNSYSLFMELNGSTASKLKLKEGMPLLQQEKLWIRKRDDISKLTLLNSEFFELNRSKGSGLSEIDARRGGYKSINILVKTQLEYFSTELAFFASLRSLEDLIQELRILKMSGIGKKRNMGFGDLISWKIYKISTSNKNIGILSPMILFNDERNYTRIITLRNLPSAILSVLKSESSQLLPMDMKLILSRTRPPYWLREELCLMPFSEFLLRN